MFKSYSPATALLLLLLAVGLPLLYYFDEPLRRQFGGVKSGVVLQGEPVEGLFRSEVAAVVEAVARREGRKPVDAYLEESKSFIVPEINGLAVDREATVEMVMNAPRGAVLTPVYREIAPSTRWEHYPFLPARRGNPCKPAVALMIIVDGGEEYLPGILEALKKAGVSATFFLRGPWASKKGELVRRIAGEGHELGCYGNSADNANPEPDPWAVARSLRKTGEAIFALSGRYPLYFTPPEGAYDSLILEIVSRQGMRTVLPSPPFGVPGEEGPAKVAEVLSGRVSPGMIIPLFTGADTVQELAQLLPPLREQGLAVMTVGELLSPKLWPAGEGGALR